jgi:hypothetical protein
MQGLCSHSISTNQLRVESSPSSPRTRSELIKVFQPANLTFRKSPANLDSSQVPLNGIAGLRRELVNMSHRKAGHRQALLFKTARQPGPSAPHWLEST